MKIANILSAGLFLVSTASFADAVCLSRATNLELLNEISRRMDSTTPGSQSAVVSVNCNSWQLQINLTSLDGATSRSTLNFSNDAACSNFVTQFGSSKTLRANKIIGACNSWQLTRLLLKTDATVAELPAINYRNAAECETEAAALIRL